MNRLNLSANPSLFIEISQVALRLFDGGAGLELPLERLPNGRLTPAGKAEVTASMKRFLNRSPWQPRLRAWCAVDARGVLLRRVNLPAAAAPEFQQLLRLQIESEFPLPPEDLAWGYGRLEPAESNGSNGRQELVVAAVRKEVVADYVEILNECGISPTFTLAALARSYLCPPAIKNFAELDVGPEQSEWLHFAQGVPVALRILPWGAGRLPTPDLLTAAIAGSQPGEKLYVSGGSPHQQEIVAGLHRDLAAAVDCVPLEFGAGVGRSATTLGLQRAAETDGGRRLILLQVKPTQTSPTFANPEFRKWAGIAALLLIGCLLFPYAEAWLLKSHLSRKLNAAQAARGTLASIDRELGFLQYLKQNQSPYLDALYLLANAAPGGTHIDSLSLNRRGEISWRGNLRDLQQVLQYRTKLMESGFFANVTVEEQTPTPDRQKVNVRMTAQWKPASARESIKLGPTAEEMEQIKAAAKETGAGGPPMMGSPFPMMPGMPPPMPEMGLPPPGPARGRVSPPRPPLPPDSAPPANLPLIVSPPTGKQE